MPGPNSADRRPDTQDHPVLFQQFFKSGARTYVAQVKQAVNGKPFLVLTEGKRDPKTEDVKKSKLFVFSEDLTEFFRLLQETATFLRPLRQQMKDGIVAPVSAAAGSQVSMKPAVGRVVSPASPASAGKLAGSGGNGKSVASVVQRSVTATATSSRSTAPARVATPTVRPSAATRTSAAPARGYAKKPARGR